jgi:hypothetical protein
MKPGAMHALKDPSRLTKAEEKIYELMKQGLTGKEIAERIGSGGAGAMNCRIKVIREKIAARLMPTG